MSRFSITDGSGIPGQPYSPQPPPRKRSWDEGAPVDALENWIYVRRNELAQLATPFMVAQIHREQDPTLAVESWKDDPEGADERLVKRAVSLAKILQREIDAARPRP